MDDPMSRPATRDIARLERRLDQLRREMADLSGDVRGLHEALNTALQSAGSVGEGGDDLRIEDLVPPLVDERDPLLVRGLRRIKRLALGAIRRLRTATDPGQEHLRWLEFVRDEETAADATLWTPGDGGPTTDLGLDEDLAFLFARTSVSAVWSAGGGSPAFRAVRGAADPFAPDSRPEATSVGLDCDGGPWPDGVKALAHRDPADAHGWRSGPWRVRAPDAARRLPVVLRRATEVKSAPQGTVLILLGEGLEGGLEQRVLPAVDALISGSVPVRVVVAAVLSAVGEARLRALARLGASVCRLERMIPPQLRDDRLAELGTGVERLWIVGGGPKIQAMLETLRGAAGSGLRVVTEPGAGGVVEGFDVSPLPWPLVLPPPMDAVASGASTEATVLIAGDWVASSRPEDAVFLARELAGDARIRLVGDGPRGPAVRDLAAVLGLSEALEIRPPDGGVPDHRPSCVAWLGEGPWVPPSVIAAVTAGIPAVVPSVGVLPEFAALHPDQVIVSGTPGDVSAAAQAIRRAMAMSAPVPRAEGDRLEATIAAARDELLEALTP
jgi:hypothetical protein